MSKTKSRRAPAATYAPRFEHDQEVDFRLPSRVWQLATVHLDDGGDVVLVKLPNSERIMPVERAMLVADADLKRGNVPAHLAPR